MPRVPLATIAALTTLAVGAHLGSSAGGLLSVSAAFAATPRQLAEGPTASSPQFPSAGAGAIVLYDQSSPPGMSGAYYVNADPPPDQAYASEGADDFQVTDAVGWTVTEFSFSVNFVQPSGLYTGTPNYNVNIYPDVGGLPGSTSVCGGNDIEGIRLDPLSNRGVVVVPLPEACFLSPGHYWVGFSTIVVVPPSGLWSFNGTPEEIMQPAMWRNPGGALISSCPTWSPALGCLGGFSGGWPAFNFQVVGNPGQSIVDEIFANGFELIP